MIETNHKNLSYLWSYTLNIGGENIHTFHSLLVAVLSAEVDELAWKMAVDKVVKIIVDDARKKGGKS